MIPEISVIVPTYNREGFLGSTLDSILSQTVPPAEVIVVDDGSTDGTREMVSSQYGDRVRYVSIPNSGVCRARNIGVGSSRCPWIAFCDSDDLWLPRRLEAQIQLCGLDPRVEYLFTDFYYVNKAVRSSQSKFCESAAWQAKLRACGKGEGFSVIEEPLYLDFMSFGPIFPSTVLMTRRRIDAMGGFDERWTRTSIEDFDFTLRCLQTPPFGVVSEPLAEIRRHDSNASGNRVRDLVAYVDILEYSKIHHRLGPENARAIDGHVLKASIDGAELAFAGGQLDIVKRLLETIPSSRLKAKTRIKKWIAMRPPALRSTCSKILLKAAAGARRVRRAE